MICVRCSNESANVVAQAPDGSEALEIIYCSKCNFSWRTSEEDQSIASEKRDKMFQLEGSALDNLQVLVPLPPLRIKA